MIDVSRPCYKFELKNQDSLDNIGDMSVYQLVAANPDKPLQLIMNFDPALPYTPPSEPTKGILQKECIQLDSEYNQMAKLKYSQLFRNWSPCQVVLKYK